MKIKLKAFMSSLLISMTLISSLFHSTVNAAEAVALNGVNIPNKNAVALQWLSQIQNPGDYQYRVFQKPDYATSFQTIPVMYTSKLQVLWISMLNNQTYINAIKDSPAKSGVEDSVSIDVIYYTDYNKNPASYLKDSLGNYKYNVMFFGAYNLEGNARYDLSNSAKDETSKFLDTGHGVIFSHDTIRQGHPNYNELGKKYANIDIVNKSVDYGRETIGGRSVDVANYPGILTSYPKLLPTTLNINLTHTSSQILSSSNVNWIKFNKDTTWGNKNLVDSKDNFYLATYNNTAMIQTGHTTGFTSDEQSVLMNLFFYMAQLTPNVNFADASARDLIPPDKPTASIQGNMLLLRSNDNGTNYDFYVEAVNQKNGNKIQSNKVSVLNKAGIAGYIITYDEEPGVEPKYGTMPTIPSSINAMPIDVVKNRGKYANITAVDFAGNYSKTTSINVYSEVDPLNLTATNASNNNYINLNWVNPDKSEDQQYRVFQSSNSMKDFESKQTNFGNPVKILHVYPYVGNNDLVNLVNAYGPKDINNNNLIIVTPIRIDAFNSNPSKYLRSDGTSTGQFIYDEIVFGFSDYNRYADRRGDLSDNAKDEVEKFLKAGRGVLLGHDTILGALHPNFKYIGTKYMGMNPLSSYLSKAIGSTKVVKASEGTLTEYPYPLNGQLSIPQTHSSSQILGLKSKTWFKFASPINYGRNNLITDNSCNFYLATSNNIGMIQTGHVTGRTTPDEAKILVNTIFYLSQLTSNTNYEDKTAKDFAEPLAPKVNINGNIANLSSEDKGTTYDYYVESVSQKTGNKISSNKISVDSATGIKQYLVVEDNYEDTIPSQFPKVIPASSSSYNLTGNGKYLHIIAVDNAGNKSAVTHISLK